MSKPSLKGLLEKLSKMNQDQLMVYLSDESKRRELYFKESEVKELGTILKRLVSELHDQT